MNELLSNKASSLTVLYNQQEMRMIQLMKQIIQKTPLYNPLSKWLAKRRYQIQFEEWKRNGRPVPPPHIVKQRTLQLYSKKYGLKVLVETGTYYGAMVEAMKDVFDHIYSIEISKELYELARERFKTVKHIELINGDSGVELKNVIDKLEIDARPALFWLDGHYSGGVTSRGNKDTPINEELSHILGGSDRGHVIIIDDARLFGIDPAYPNMEELKAFIKSKRVDVDIVVQDDSIRIVPKEKLSKNGFESM